MEDFTRIVKGNMAIYIVKLTRATYKEARELKFILSKDINDGLKKIIVDLNQCEFMDSTFIGALVVTLKELTKIGGELCLVRPKSIAHTILESSGTLKFFNIKDTLDKAVQSMEYIDTLSNYDFIDKDGIPLRTSLKF